MSPSADSQHLEAQVRIAADHPSLPGHFPGRAVVPGVLLLERVLEAAERGMGAPLRVIGLPQVKFIAPLLPEEAATVRLDRQGHALRFRVERAGQVIALGAFRLA